MVKIYKLNELFISMRQELARSILKIVPPDTVEDIVQDTYVRLCRVKDHSGIRHPRAFLYETIKNLAFDHIKRAEYRLNISIDGDELDHPSGDTTLRDVVAHEEFGRFCDAVRHLPIQCRRVFVLKKVYNYSQREIAVELGLSESTVEKHIALGLRRCRSYMENNEAKHDSASVAQLTEMRGGAE